MQGVEVGLAVRVHRLRRARRRAADPDHHAVLAAAAVGDRRGARRCAAEGGAKRRGRRTTRRIGAGRVEFAERELRLRPGRPVLHDVSPATCPPAASSASSGHTGSGKSTLLSLLLRFYAPQSGPHRHRRHPGRRRSTRPFPRERGPGAAGAVPAGGERAREHRHGPRPDRTRRSRRAARAAHAHDFIERAGAGLRHRRSGEGGARLSVGPEAVASRSRARSRASRASCSSTRPLAHRQRDRAGGAGGAGGAARRRPP